MVKPFSRPSINIGKVTRKWQDIEAQNLEVGDLVPDLGKIEKTYTFWHDEDEQFYTIAVFKETAEELSRARWKATDTVHAFSEVSNG
jgi:hypothetical protein